MMLDPDNVWHWPIYAALIYAIWPVFVLVISVAIVMWLWSKYAWWVF